MNLAKRILVCILSAVILSPVIFHQPVMVSAANEVVIMSPQPDNWVTDQYVVRYNVSNLILPTSIQISYRNAMNTEAQVMVVPNLSSTTRSSYTTLIQGLGVGANYIKVTAQGQDGQIFSDIRQVTVDPQLTNIHSDQTNIAPYVNDRNQFKHMLKISNEASAKEHGLIPKDNAFVSRFVDLLFEEAALEKVRPDIVFAQMMLETGWLSYLYTVQETQNNFGGIGATGGPVRGNVFLNMREGIRVNVQHLVAYASARKLNGTLADPRFNYVTRGNAPAVEYLGYQENIQGGGWAMGHQYGYKIRNIIDRTSKSSNLPFDPTPGTAAITDMEVSSVLRSKTNALNITLEDGFAPGQELRVAVATNSDTEHRFTFTNRTTNQTVQTAWTENKAAFYTPTIAGNYRFSVQIRQRGATTVKDVKEQDVTIGEIIEQPDPDRDVIPVIGTVLLSSSPYYPGTEIGIQIEDVSEATTRVNEYQLEVEHAGKTTLLSSWSGSRVYEYTPQTTGTHMIRVLSRNKLIGGEAVQSATVTVEVEEAPVSQAVIASISSPTGGVYVNRPASVTVTPIAGTGMNLEYRLIDQFVSPARILRDWSLDPKLTFTPTRSGELNLTVQARQQSGNGTVLEEKGLKLQVLAEPVADLKTIALGTGPYVKGSPLSVSVTPYRTDTAYEYRLFLQDGAASLPLTQWGSSSKLIFTPTMKGSITLGVRAREIATGREGALKTIQATITDASVPVYGPTSYTPENPYSISLNGMYTAGIKAAGKNLEINAAPVRSDYLYRYYLISQSTGQKIMVQDWSSQPKATWKALTGYYTVVVEARHAASRSFWDVRRTESIRIKNYPTVFLDPGHGGTDKGVTVLKNGVTYSESNQALYLSNLVRTKLKGRGINVVVSRSTNTTVSLDRRIELANNAKADLFVSFHYNKSSISTTKGIRTYFAGAKLDPLANLYQPEGKEAAGILSSKVAPIYTRNLGIISDVDHMGYSFRILKNTQMPAAQLNLGYLSNVEDLARIKSSSYRDKLAQAIADGIMNYMNAN
ncbi:N-acetylmuramoyl-L-alanine amidase [anaerobic digester metagenome]